jgi:hypothetical protein
MSKQKKRKQEYDDHLRNTQELVKIYRLLVERYTKMNGIELPPKDDDVYLNTMYSFVWDAKFIDSASDESGIIFNEDMFNIEATDEELKEFERSGTLDFKDPNE